MKKEIIKTITCPKCKKKEFEIYGGEHHPVRKYKCLICSYVYG